MDITEVKFNRTVDQISFKVEVERYALPELLNVPEGKVKDLASKIKISFFVEGIDTPISTHEMSILGIKDV